MFRRKDSGYFETLKLVTNADSKIFPAGIFVFDNFSRRFLALRPCEYFDSAAVVSDGGELMES